MKYPKDYLDEIKVRLKVSNVVSRSVSLKKRGKEFVGLSPFKNERTPSFTVNDEKEFYHCFASGEHGNIFDFVMKTQNLRFGEAVKFLASLAGMKPYTFSKQDEQREKDWNIYKDIYKTYVDYFQNELLKSEYSTEAKSYLKNRGLRLEDVKNFNLGYVTNKIDFYDYLLKKFDKQNIKNSGIFYQDEKKQLFINRFRERIIFPIKNISGDIIAIGGRSIKENNYLAKYINSPETQFFKKGSNLYNLDKSRKLSNKVDYVYLVEGYMDVIGLNKNNINNVVANLGTALTTNQISILNQFFNSIIICFDGDESGYKAALRAAENSIIEIKPEKKILFLFLPDKHDPDSYVNKFGKNTFLEYSNQNSIEIHKFIFNHYYKEIDDNPSSKAIFEKKLKSIASSIKDEYIKKYVLDYYLEEISKLSPNIYRKSKYINKKNNRSLKTTQRYFNETKSLTSIEIKEFSFLYILINKPKFIRDNFYLIENVKLFTNENKMLFETLKEQSNNFQNFDIKKINIDQKLIDRVFKYASVKNIWNKTSKDEKIESILNEVIRDLKNYELEIRILDLEEKFSKDLSEDTFNELKELKKLQNLN
ncbi:DNA primase [Candidatus Pelagibacter sp.]|nr:DNA primase [Candidatus Pelagibacter sp.]